MVGGPFFKRKKAIDALNQIGGELIEIPYTTDVSSSKLKDESFSNGITTDGRKKTLKRLLQVKPITRFIEAHSPISAIIAEKSRYIDNTSIKEFDGFWSSSLTDSIEMGMPDIEALDVSKRLLNIDSIFNVTTKPLIMDLDTGGKLSIFKLILKRLKDWVFQQ